MDLRLFFDGLSAEITKQYKALEGFGANISYHDKDLPQLEKTDIALFSISEAEEKSGTEPSQEAFTELRSTLYGLKGFTKEIKIVDLGNLRVGANTEETYGRLAEVCSYLLRKNVLPLIIAGDHELDMGQFLAYQDMEKLLSVLTVDAKIDMEVSNGAAFGHTQQMLLHHPNYLFDYCHLGYQRYFVDKEVLNTFIKLNFEMKSIGQMRDNLQDIEPLVRAADMLSFDVSAIKHTDLPLNNPIHPFGLTGEEACQLSWYAGTNEKLTSVGFYGIEDENKQNVLVSKVVATIIWYFIEGFAHRKVEYSFKSNFHIKYIVPLMGSGKNLQAHELVFYKSRQTDKWWMEIPTTPDEIKNFGRNVIIPCSYTDYETANKGIVPDRWLKAMEKYT